MRRRFFLTAAFAGWILLVPAQQVERVWEQHPFPAEYATVGTIYDIAFDKAGAVWVAIVTTEDIGVGGCKYESGIWTEFRATQHVHHGDNDTVEEDRNEIGGYDNSSIAIDYRGNVWFGSAYHGSCRLSGTTWKHITTVSGLASNTIQQILPVRDTIWIATNKGLSRFCNDTIINHLAGKNVTCLAIDLSENLWAGTSEGAYKFDGTTWSLPHLPIKGGTLANNWFDALTLDAKGNIWAAIYDFGIYMYDGETWSLQYSDKVNKFNCLAFDKKGHLWAGRFGGGGVWEFDGKSRMHYSTQYDSLLNNNVQSIAVNNDDGAVWLGSFGGLTKIYDRKVVNISDIEWCDNIKIYPNPVQNQFTVSNIGDAIISLYTVFGQKIETYHSQNENITIDASHLASGIYVLKITKDNKTRSFKISVVR